MRWAEDLDLCNAWQEGADLATEHARRVRVKLPRQPRATPGEQHLAQSTLENVSIERGVTGDDRQREVAAVTSTVSNWEVTPPEGNITYWSLDAEVRHDFGAEVGTVIESYELLSFSDGSVGDVVVGDPNSYGSNFYFLPAGAGDLDAIFLERCAPTQETHLVVEALVGEVQSGPHAGRHFQVTRYVQTFDVFAGSYPVYWDATDVFFTDASYAGLTVFGQWAHTYSAAHHNWDEASRVLPRSDVGAYHTLFSELDRGEGLPIEAISKVEWHDVTSFAQPGTMTITLQDLTTGVESEHPVALQGAFVDLSPRSLVRQAQGSCDDVDVRAIGGFAYSGVASDVFQLVMCPNASPLGFELLGVLPVAFSVDPTAVGVLADRDAITQEGDGYEVALGEGTLVIEPLDGSDSFVYEVLDGQGESMISSLAFPTELQAPTPRDEVTSGTADGVSFELRRRIAAPGVGESVLYAPVSLQLSVDGESFFVDGFDQLLYTNSHHNWADRLVATTGGVEIEWWVEFDAGVYIHHVQATRDGAEFLPDTVLTTD